MKLTRSRRKFVVISCFVVTIMCAGAWFVFAKSKRDFSNQKIEKVSRKDVVHRLFLNGKIKPASSVVISSPMGGRVETILVKEGANVKEGDMLATLRLETSGQQEIIEKRTEVERLAFEVKSLESRLQEKSSVRELLASAQLQKEQDDLNSKKLELQSARSRLELLEQEIGFSSALKKSQKHDVIQIRAPSGGIVTLIQKSVGDYVGIGSGTTSSSTNDRNIMVLADMSALTVKTKVLEADLRYVQKGQPATVKLDAYPDKNYEGLISHVGGQGRVDDKGGYTFFDVEVSIAKPDSMLRPEMNATVDLVFAKRENVLSLPVSSVVVFPDRAFVHLQDSNSEKGFVEKSVTVGIVTEQDVEIVSGLGEGDSVVEVDFSKVDFNAGKDSEGKTDTGASH